MAVSFSRPDPSSSAAVSSATFPTVRRGFDPDEVRDFLRMVSVELARVQERERYLERELNTARTAVRAVPEPLDEDMVTEMLGEEAARVLSTAREAASSIRSKAEDGASRLLREAQDEAAAVREQAELEAVRRRQDAAHDAEAELESARQQGREMVEEARQYREKVLTDLNRRRELARQQIAHLLSGRDRLIGAYERARVVATDIISEITDVGDEPDEYVNLAAVTGPIPITIPRASASAASTTSLSSASQRRPEPPVMLGRDAATPGPVAVAPTVVSVPAVSVVPPLRESTPTVIDDAVADLESGEVGAPDGLVDAETSSILDQAPEKIDVELEADEEADADVAAVATAEAAKPIVAPAPVAVAVPGVVEVGLAPVVALFGQRDEVYIDDAVDAESVDVESVDVESVDVESVDGEQVEVELSDDVATEIEVDDLDSEIDSGHDLGIEGAAGVRGDDVDRAADASHAVRFTAPVDMSASSVDSLFAKLRESRAQKIASEVFYTEPAVSAPTESVSAESVSADVQVESSASAAESKPLAVIEERVNETRVIDDVFQRTADASAAPAGEQTAREDPIVALTARIARSLKRVLADEQNDVLNVLRRKDPVRSIDLLVPWESEHVDQYVLSIADDVMGGLDEATQWVSATIVMPLRRELESAVNELAGDNARLANEVRAFYRDLRTQVIDETAQAIASACAVTSGV